MAGFSSIVQVELGGRVQQLDYITNFRTVNEVKAAAADDWKS